MLLAALLLLSACSAPAPSVVPRETLRPAATPRPTPLPISTATPQSSEKSDPYGLSFRSSSYFEEASLRERLSHSPLEYCSQVFQEGKSTVLTWNLRSNDEEVYRCTYRYVNKTGVSEPTQVSCQKGEAFSAYQNGDTSLKRYYVMPEAGDGIDMFVYPKSSSYYEKYFILGKYSDMHCEIRGNDIYFDYYWYQDEEEPLLVYHSSAVNYRTVSGERHHEELWELYEESRKNINIIPYEDYPRDSDPYEIWRQWEKQEDARREEKDLQEKIEEYCSCGDEEDLYELYREDFDDIDDATAFWESYCQ